MRKILFLKLFFYCFVAFSQVGIGTDFPNTSAQLDIVSIDKGVLLPRIALIGTDDVTTISNGNKGGLLIYNTATTEGANEVTPGFYYWSESKNIWIGLTVNATTSRSGGIQLAGDLTGSASAPIVADGAITNIKLASTTGTESVVLSDSAILTGNPQAPTPATTDNSTALATTAFVKAVATSGNVADEINDGTTTVAPSQNAVFDALGLKVDKAAGERLITALEITTLENQMGTNTGDQDLSGFVTSTALDLKANLISPTFTGTPQAPTPLFADNSKTIATTAFVKAVATTSVTDAISDGETTMAPSQNAVFDALDSKENTITATSNTDYYRGDKTFQTLDKAAVGLPNVDNTSDSDKPVSAATTTAMGLKEDAITATTTTDYYRGDKTFQTLNKTVVGLPNVDNTSDAVKPVSTATQTALDSKVPKVTMTDNALPRANGTDGTLQNSTVTISDLGVIAAGGFSSTGSISSDSSITAGGTLNVSKFVAGNSKLQVSNFDNTSTSDATFDMYAAGGNVTQAFSNNSNDIVWGLDKADNTFKMTWDYNFASGFFLKVNPSGQINLPLIAASKSLELDAQNNIVGVDAAYGHVTGITTQSIPHATGVNLTTYWNGTPRLSGGVSFSNGVFTVATAGFYQISVSFSYGTNGAGARSANIRVNNSTLVGYQNAAPVSNDRTGMNLSAGIYMNAGDNVRILVYQGSGVTLNTDGAIGGNFSITKTGN